jgi:hypothetical protein
MWVVLNYETTLHVRDCSSVTETSPSSWKPYLSYRTLEMTESAFLIPVSLIRQDLSTLHSSHRVVPPNGITDFDVSSLLLLSSFMEQSQLYNYSRTYWNFWNRKVYTTVLTRVFLCLSWRRSIQPMQPHAVSLRPNTTLSPTYVFVFLVVSALLTSPPNSYMHPLNYLITLITLGEEYKSWSFLQPPAVSTPGS